MPARNADLGDFNRLADACLRLWHTTSAAHMGMVDVDVALAYLRDACESGRVLVVGDYAVLWDTGNEWYSSKPYLIEQLVIRLGYNHPSVLIDDAVRALESLAKQLGCAMIAAGDTQTGRMVPIYQRNGFRTIGTQLVKEVPDGSSSSPHRRNPTG